MFHSVMKRLAATKFGHRLRFALLACLRYAAGLYVRVWRIGTIPGVVSVVVPFYNVERYLDECLLSLRRQNYPWLEIIVVDDGSPDGSYEIARRHARRDPRIRIVRQQNGGLSAARNTGSARARGKYLMFVDSDDVVMRTTVGACVKSLRASGSDFAVFGYQRLRTRGTQAAGEWIRRAHSKPERGATVETRPDIQVNAVAWSKLYVRKFFQRNGLMFPVGRLYEDQPVSSLAYALARGFDILPDVGLNWRVREDSSSISQQLTSPDNLTAQVDAGIESVEIMRRHGKHEAATERAVQVLDINLMFYASSLLIADEEFYAAFRSALVRLWDLADEDHRRRRLDMRTRVICALVLSYERSDVLEFLASSRTGFNSNPIVWIDDKPVLDMPVRSDPRYDLDPELFVLTEKQMGLVAGVRSFWFSKSKLHVRGWAYVAGTTPEESDPAPEIWLAHESGDIRFQVERIFDPAIDEFSRNEYVDYRASGFHATLPISQLPRNGGGLIRARVTTHGVTGEDAIYRRGQPEPGRTIWTSLGGGRMVYVAAPGGRALSVETDNGIRMAKMEAFKAATAGVLRSARVDGDEIILEVETKNRDVTNVGIVGRGNEILAHSVQRSGKKLTARIRLVRDEWGRHAVPLRSGAYAVRLFAGDKVIDVDLWPAESLAQNCPIDELTDSHRVRLRLRHVGSRSVPKVELTSPLALDERGARNQTRLRMLYADRKADQNAFLMRSLYGEVANCNPKGLHEAIMRAGIDIPVYWSVADHSVPVPEGGIKVIERSALWHEKMRTSRFMMVNVHQLPWYRKTDPDQVLIETFHGYPYKLMGHDWWTFAGFPPTQVASFDSRARDWTYVVSPASYSTDLLKHAFTGPAESTAEYLEIGYPRNDVLQRPEGDAVRRATRELLGIGDDEKAVLYAPTFRDYLSDDDMTAKYVDFLDTDRLAETLGSKTRLLMRGHPFNVRSGESLVASDRIIDVSAYPDINDLILASDAGILDYSSLRFDYALTDKPIVFFVPDLEEYHENRPGLLPYEATAPGPLARDTDAVAEALADLDKLSEEWHVARAAFRAGYADLDDGHAGERLLDVLGLTGTPAS